MPRSAPAWWTFLFFTFIFSPFLIMLFLQYFQLYNQPRNCKKDTITQPKINLQS